MGRGSAKWKARARAWHLSTPEEEGEVEQEQVSNRMRRTSNLPTSPRFGSSTKLFRSKC